MRSLPLYQDFGSLRAVHACWNEQAIETLGTITKNGLMSGDQYIYAADKTHELFKLVEMTTKGPEISLPDGYVFVDKDGTKRSDVRVQWWRGDAKKWADIAMSVPDPDQLPSTPLPDTIMGSIYPKNAKPVFFGHYWLSGNPSLQAHNALCLDYSAGKDGPLIAYHVTNSTTHEIDLMNIMSAPK